MAARAGRPANPENAGKKQTATVEAVAQAMAAEDASIFKQKKVGFATIEKAINLAKGFNTRFKAPDAFVAEMARLKAEGRSGGLRGQPRKKVGETGEYTVNNRNKKKGTVVAASVVIPLVMYEWAAAEGAKVKVFFEKTGPVVSRG